MDKGQKLTAKYLVNKLSEEELSLLIRDFGEERFHRRIAGAIVSARGRKEIETTFELAELISGCVPYGKKYNRIHPATRTFQALRIFVNDELSAIEEGMEKTRVSLKKGGVVCAISFHSLEDRIVKNILRRFKNEGIFRVLTKKPLIPAEDELLENPRSRSAKLRAAERVL
jgi:16S rRNA (cytosine1402-N4)-methyltransferase